MTKFVEVARKAAYQAGEFLLSNLDGVREIRYKGKGHRNPYSQVDTGAESIILKAINDAFPAHSFISEERGRKDTFSDYTWVVDPLDGTINFIHKYRNFGVSISLLYREDIILGVVYNPVMDEMFTAVKGDGAYLNERRIQVSKTRKLEESLLAAGFPYDRHSEAFSISVKHFVRLAEDSQAIRRDGSTALSLCSVACGRYDGFCVAGNELWDYAAGILIVTEAGGKVTDFRGEPVHLNNKRNEILASNEKIHRIMLESFRDERAR